MNDERWHAVDAAFDAALEVEGEARAALLAGLEAEDPELRRAVERLLALEPEAGGFLSGPEAFETLAALTANENVRGARIGPYRVERRLGHGGMGEVFLAERADEHFEKRVAIKVLAGPGTPGLLRRFRTERQILAGFEHPSIARLIDGGVTEEGQLYLVLEYVDGMPIDRFCRRHRLGLEKRLRLFLDVCSAVNYAHQQLIVHRDLKPANILVTADGVPKLLDFGIAKVLDPGQFPLEPTETRLHQRAFTLQYASPEQIRGEAITTATDVYGLGLLLHEMVTGAPAVTVGGLGSGEIERRICEIDPPLASRTLAGAEAAEDLPIRPQQLRGDLDTILAKALAKEPSRRYASIHHFAEDLERHLDQRPISARSGGWLYPAIRFVQRRALGVALLGALFAVLLGFLFMQRQHARQLARERDDARSARDQAEEVSRYLREVFTNAHPETSRGDPLTARELLEKGAEDAWTRLDSEGELQIELMLTMADAYAGLGLHAEAIELYERSRHRLQRQLGPTHGKVAEASAALGSLWEWRGDRLRAEAYLREALTLRTARLGERHPATVESLTDMAKLRKDQGRFAEARSLYRRALGLQREILGPSDLATLETRMGLAMISMDLGDLSASEEILLEVLPLLQEKLGADHPKVATALHNLGAASDDPRKSKHYYDEALKLRRQLYDADDPRTAKTRSNLVNALTRLADPRAVPLAEEALASRRRRLGEEHPQIGHALAALGEALYRAGRVEEGLATFRASIAHAEKTLEPNHPNIAYPVGRLGTILVELDRADEAEPLLRRAVEIRELSMDESAPLLLSSRADLEKCRERLGTKL